MNKLVAATGSLLAAGLAVVGLSLAPAAAAPAQPPTNPGCGSALLALTQAEKAAQDATSADTAAANAKKDDDAQADADAAEAAARAAALNGGVTTADLTDSGAALRTQKAALEAIENPTQTNKDDLIKVNAKLALVDAFVAAHTKAVAAKAVADKTDAEALRREADKTDAAALVDAAGKAGDAADKACGAGSGVRFENCDQVRAAGLAPLRSDQPGYRVRLDADRDGLACEPVENTVTPTPRTVPVPSSINTGLAA